MRPQFREPEATFILNILIETKAKVEKQFADLNEEAEYLSYTVPALRRKFLMESDWTAMRKYKRLKERQEALKFSVINETQKQLSVLNRLITHFKNMLEHKRGRLKGVHFWSESYLNEMFQKTSKNPNFRSIH